MLFTKDALHYAKLIKDGQVTSLELVQYALENIKKLNPTLNAISHIQEEYAVDTAKKMDERLAKLSKEEKQKLPPFYGVPTVLKDLGQNQAGMLSTAGSKILKNYVAQVTDHFTEKVLEAGFVIVGRSNVPEFGFKGVSDSKTTGAVESPFKVGYNPGGSSGGAAVAVKSGMVPIAMASDGGGSIRIPASFTGLIGLKPSRGRIIVGPNGYRGWQGASVNFAVTKSTRDTWELLNALQVEQFEAPFMIPRIHKTTLTTPEKPLRIAYSIQPALEDDTISSEAKAAVLKGKFNLENLGHEVIEESLPVSNTVSLKAYYKMNTVEAAAMIDGIESGLGRELTYEDIEPLTWLMSNAGQSILAKDFTKVLNEWDQITVKLETFFKKYDALLLPVANGPSPKQDQFDPSEELLDRVKRVEEFEPHVQQDLLWEYFSSSQRYMGFNQQQNLAGQPSVALPMYQTEDGWPIGVQLWTRKGNDYLLLQLAKQLEENGYLLTDIKEIGVQ